MATSDVRTVLFDVAPELTTSDSTALARVDRFIGYAAAELNADIWADAETADGVTAGAYFNMANALLAAHKLTLRAQGPSGAAGPVVSEKIGGVSTTYAYPMRAGGSGPSVFDATSYGRQYEEFRRSVLPIAVAISGESLNGISDTSVDDTNDGDADADDA